MKVTIDRFEGEFAVCEKPDRTLINIPRNRLPAGAMEGDILVLEGEMVGMDDQATSKRKKDINLLMNDLWK
jgi:hypothetical protein